jgi:hypothetical protein
VTPEEIAAKFSDTWMCGCGEADCPSIERLAAAIRAAVEEEREACAKVADGCSVHGYEDRPEFPRVMEFARIVSSTIAAAIRSRS